MSLQYLTLTLDGITAADYLAWVRDPEPPALGLSLDAVAVDAEPLGDTIEVALSWNRPPPAPRTAAVAAGLPLTEDVRALQSRASAKPAPPQHPKGPVMKKLVATLTLAVALAAAGPVAAKPIAYAGKTTGGHRITFKLSGNKIVNPVTAVPVQCLSIQGGGSPSIGPDPMYPLIKLKLGQNVDFKTKQKPSSYYNEVVINQRFSSRRSRNGTISGKLRMQYSYLIPKYPIGTFVIYSCLGTTTYKAKPKR